ncbi:hypothetical protein GCM10027321_39910 [Massilia terrae]|uniref:DUF6531 domain-containing protein n=1 Tax=Massilia terrae TaxID=1811224 RepID=A0ABT2D3C7_9BURK|nr:DUF6531 domain-containing protein [Massilia terrae]MCS0659828.1 DUF6531 domain-containing protein [Massilia terrae]
MSGSAERMSGYQSCPAAALRRSLAFIVILGSVLLIDPASAQSCSPSPGGEANSCSVNSVASLGASSGTNLGVGNPINVVTGNKYQREDDMPALPGILGLEIVRHYNSAYSAPANWNGVIGRLGRADGRPPERFTSLAEARKKLALLEEFKEPGSNCCVLQEYTVKAPIPIRKGSAGALTSRKPPYDSYAGGAEQYQLLLDKVLNWRDFLEPSPNPAQL